MLLDQHSLSEGYRHRAVMYRSLLFWANVEDVKPAAQFRVPQKETADPQSKRSDSTVRVSGRGSVAQGFFVPMTLQGIHLIAKQTGFLQILWKENNSLFQGNWCSILKTNKFFLEITSHCAAEVSVLLSILLPQPSKCQDCKNVLPDLVSCQRIRFCHLLSLFSWLRPKHTSSCTDLAAGKRWHKCFVFTLADSRASHLACVHALSCRSHGWSTSNYNLPLQTTIGFITSAAVRGDCTG